MYCVMALDLNISNGYDFLFCISPVIHQLTSVQKELSGSDHDKTVFIGFSHRALLISFP